MVEFALAMPVFMFLVLMMFDFGRVIYAQNTISQDAREAIRSAEVWPAYSQSKYDDIRTAALRMAPAVPLVAADVSGEAGVVCPTPDGTSPTACFYPAGILANDRIEVNISVRVPLLTPIIANLFGGSMTLTARSNGYIQCSGC